MMSKQNKDNTVDEKEEESMIKMHDDTQRGNKFKIIFKDKFCIH